MKMLWGSNCSAKQSALKMFFFPPNENCYFFSRGLWIRSNKIWAKKGKKRSAKWHKQHCAAVWCFDPFNNVYLSGFGWIYFPLKGLTQLIHFQTIISPLAKFPLPWARYTQAFQIIHPCNFLSSSSPHLTTFTPDSDIDVYNLYGTWI